MIRPTHVRILLGRSEKNSTSAKKITEKTASSVTAPPVSSGSTPMVKLVAAQRGMAKSGPIVRYSAQVKNTPYPFPTRLLMASRSSERLMPNAATPMSGRPTAVTMKPNAATKEFAPASWPMCTGKIRFPAPKNNPNSMLATAMSCRKFNLSFISHPS